MPACDTAHVITRYDLCLLFSSSFNSTFFNSSPISPAISLLLGPQQPDLTNTAHELSLLDLVAAHDSPKQCEWAGFGAQQVQNNPSECSGSYPVPIMCVWVGTKS